MRKKGLEEIAGRVRIKGWSLRDDDHDDYEAYLEPASRHAGKNCAVVKSKAVSDKKTVARNSMGHLTQICSVDEYRNKRIRMTAWAKSELAEAAYARIEINVIGEWGWYCKWRGTFDNLGENPIRGTTDWTKYELVVDVPQESISMSFGVLMIGVGKVWIDDFSFEVVDKSVPLTGIAVRPHNLNFQD